MYKVRDAVNSALDGGKRSTATRCQRGWRKICVVVVEQWTRGGKTRTLADWDKTMWLAI